MAFCNLFTNLGGEGELKDPNHRNNTNNGQEGSSKRKPQTMKSGPYAKRQCPQPYTAATCDAVQNEEPKTHGFNRANNNNPRPGVSRNATYRHNPRTFMSDDVNRGSANNTTNKKKKKMKNKGKKKRERERENGQRYRNAQKDKRNKDNTQPHKPFMSQEFKEQHSLEVDGHLLCIYFLRGRCIKGEDCQFEHIEGYNGLIKEACKFYIQGFCLKGKNCPYLHDIL
ncbi:zinc finger CCCH domain-containing protein 8-like [Periophthalmus magnuspinnatus]|uniref:zinc finger CCCH domain-containing protein 8-like n=1 Tax=Periophthalmus magnuspinnatus TaxID=409849 RepID=UPI00145AAE56|nr:zinc finger CCCH domain-containing protein 8-like [Periophthalmus magnuspinnatus]